MVEDGALFPPPRWRSRTTWVGLRSERVRQEEDNNDDDEEEEESNAADASDAPRREMDGGVWFL